MPPERALDGAVPVTLVVAWPVASAGRGARDAAERRARFVSDRRDVLGVRGYRQIVRASAVVASVLGAVRGDWARRLRRHGVRRRSPAIDRVELFELGGLSHAIERLRAPATRGLWQALEDGRALSLLCRPHVLAPPATRDQVTALLFVRRHASLSRASMQRYWADRHGPLVERLADGLRYSAYRQFHRVDLGAAEAGAAPDPWSRSRHDGVAALTFPSLRAMVATIASPRAHAANLALLRDERSFVDTSDVTLFLGHEKVIF